MKGERMPLLEGTLASVWLVTFFPEENDDGASNGLVQKSISAEAKNRL